MNNHIITNDSFTYYHIYDYDRDKGLHTEGQLRFYARDQQEYLTNRLNTEDDKTLLAELMTIDPLIDSLDQVVRILQERGFNVNTYNASTFEELLSQINRIFNR